MTFRTLLLCGAVVGAPTIATGQPLPAQTPAAQTTPPAAAPAATARDVVVDDGSGDIIVTARRREESLQDVPVAVAAFNQQQLTSRGIASAFELSKAVPGLTVNASSGNPALPQFAIRGKGQNFGASAGSVETYLAEVPLSAPFQTPELPAQLFDLSSLQVLKGPQGTAFGRSTTGGAVLLVPQAPTDTFEGYARVQGGNYDNRQLEGAINIPLAGDKAALRIAGFHWQRDGYMRTFAGSVDTATLNTTNTVLPAQTFSNINQTDVRATLLLNPSESLSNSTLVTYHRDKTRSTAGAGLNVLGPDFIPGSLPTAIPGIFLSPGFGTRVVETGVNLNKPANNVWAVINTTTFKLSDTLRIKNIFGYIDSKGYTNDAADADGASIFTIDLSLPPRPRKNRQITNEIQLQGDAFDDRLSWTAGGLMDLTRQPGQRDSINITSTGPSFAADGSIVYISSFQRNEIDAYSLFASGSYKLTEQLTATAGYRHLWISQASAGAVVTEPVITGVIPATIPIDRNSIKQQGDTYNIDVAYQATDRNLVYGGFRHGYKYGGFNSTQVGAQSLTFRPETVDNFFIGSKNEFNIGEMRGRFNIEAFYDLYQNMQVNYLTQLPDGIGTITTNVPKTTFRGIDLDWTLDPARWLTLSGAYTFIDASNTKWQDTTLAGFGGDLTVNPVPFVSRNKVTATARFHSQIGELGEFAIAPSVTHQSRFYTTPIGRRLPNAQAATLGYFSGATNDAEAIQFGQFDQIGVGGVTVPGYTLFDLRVEWNKIMGSRFDAALNVINLTNKTYLIGTTGGTLIFGAQGNGYGPPRIVSFEILARF